jgi:riboflavin synthase
MFTGIITHTGTVTSIDKTGDWKFTIAVNGFTRDLVAGASIACNGACLTVIAWDAENFTVQISKETLSCTTLGTWAVGTCINLERALKVGDELGGHFVSGHVDGLARLVSITKSAESQEWLLEAPAGLGRFVAAKGSVTLDGVSLTVNKVEGGFFAVNIIPHTQQSANFRNYKGGEMLNMEVDILARYSARRRE